MRTVSWSPACPCFLLVLSLIKQNREGFEGGLRHKGARCGDRVRGHLLARRSTRKKCQGEVKLFRKAQRGVARNFEKKKMSASLQRVTAG